MKQKRAKAYRKQMEYYHLNFKFRQPYQVLVDEEIILEAVKSKFDLVKGLQRTLQAEIKPMITQCSIQHLYKTKNSDAIELAKTFERRRCNHMKDDPRSKGESKPDSKGENEEVKDINDSKDTSGSNELKESKKVPQAISAFECIVDVVNVKGQNKHRYVVATQKPKLRALFRRIPAVPLIYINRSVMIMEPMSPVTQKLRDEIEKSKLSGGLNDLSARRAAPINGDEDERPRKKRKGPKEPNPLSVKKKKGEVKSISKDDIGDVGESVEVEDVGRKKRRRKHRRGHKDGEDGEEKDGESEDDS